MADRDKKIQTIIFLTIQRLLPEAQIERENGMEIAKRIVRNLDCAGYEIIEDDYISVKIRAEITRRIQEKYNLAEDDIMGFIVEELNKLEKGSIK